VKSIRQRAGLRRARWVGGAAIAVAVIASGVAYATVPDSNGVIHGCYSKTGALSVIDSTQTCPKGTTTLNWNQSGPAGAQGPKGDTGAQGPKGDTGSLDGACTTFSGSGGTISTHVDSNNNITFTCDPAPVPPVTLTVSKDGTGSGTVSFAGVSCGATCSTSVAPGTTVTLTVAADAGSAWSGVSANCSPAVGHPTCSLTISEDTTVDFTFTAGRILTVNSTAGGFSSSPGGINCLSVTESSSFVLSGNGALGCTAAYADATPVTLTFRPGISPPAGEQWVWSGGGCAGPATTTLCTLTMDADKLVTVGPGPA
jgi:hypothetical protein